MSTTAAARHRTRRVSAALVAAVLITAALMGCSTGGSSGGSSGSSTLNVVGGFVVTDRMLGMFKAKPAERPMRTEK